MFAVLLLCISLALANGLERPRRVVGGQLAPQGQFHFMGSLQKHLVGSWYHVCGAVWLGGNRVLTAAHCLIGNSADQLRVVLGDHQLSSPNATAYSVSHFVAHPQYDGNRAGYPNDIAVVQLHHFPSPGPSTEYAIMPQDASNDFLGECAIVGWGTTSSISSVQDQLRYVNLTVISNQDCALQWAGVTGSAILDTHICAYSFNKGACHEDTGGPLVCGPKHEIAGIVSWGSHSCQGYPSVHTRVTKFLDWISFH